MQRYFVENMEKDEFIIGKEDHHHIKKVMRMKNDDEIICINKKREVYLCQIEDIESGKIRVLSLLNQDCELPVSVTLIYALPKSDKFEFVLQKATELGVDRIVPLKTRRSIIKTDRKTFHKKYERFNLIVIIFQKLAN